MSPRYFAYIYHQVQPMAKRALSRRGFTLVELLMALTAAAIILLIMGKFLTDFHASREVSNVMMEMQEQAQFAMDYMIYGFVDPNKAGLVDVRRKEGLIWASYIDNIIDSNRVSFKDPDSAALIVYEDCNNRIVKHLSSNNPSEGKVIIPYLDGSQEYLKGPFKVSVIFRKDAQPDPNRSMSIEVTVSKDKLTSTLKSAVTLRNHSSL
jgi:prepilin-type N-terminal cleavage/methylation domain-containing protein